MTLSSHFTFKFFSCVKWRTIIVAVSCEYTGVKHLEQCSAHNTSAYCIIHNYSIFLSGELAQSCEIGRAREALPLMQMRKRVIGQ